MRCFSRFLRKCLNELLHGSIYKLLLTLGFFFLSKYTVFMMFFALLGLLFALPVSAQDVPAENSEAVIERAGRQRLPRVQPQRLVVGVERRVRREAEHQR